MHSSFITTSAQQLIIIFRIDQSKAMKRKYQNALSGVGNEETSKRIPPPCPLSWYNRQGAEGEGGERAVDGRTLSEGENATPRTTTTMPISLSPSPPPPPQDPAPQDPPPPQQRNSRVSEGNVNDQHQDFHRQLALVHEEKARITNDGHSGLVSIGSSCSALYCSCCSALCSEYCRSTTSPWTSRLIFSTALLSGGCF